MIREYLVDNRFEDRYLNIDARMLRRPCMRPKRICLQWEKSPEQISIQTDIQTDFYNHFKK